MSGSEEVARFRRVAKGNTARGFGWALSSDFECGNGQECAVHSAERASFCPEPDIVTEWDDHAYTYFWCVRITNETGEDRALRLEVRAPRERFWRGWSAAQRSPLTVVDDTADATDPAQWRLAWPLAAETTEEAVCGLIEVPAGGTVYASHHFWYPLSRIEARLRLLAAVRHDVRPIVIGRTLQGRSIGGLRLLSPNAASPRVVIAGSTQASEGGHLLCLWALEHLLGETAAARAARERFTFDVVPASNPDGIVLGACMTNAVGQYAFYDAGAVGEDQDAEGSGPASAETAAMLRLVASGAPGQPGHSESPAAGYLEYHSSFHTGRPSVAYVVDLHTHADPARRAVYARTSAAVRAVAAGKHVTLAPGRGPAATPLIVVAAERYGTAGHLFKLDTSIGPLAYYAQCLEVLERYLAALAGAPAGALAGT